MFPQASCTDLTRPVKALPVFIGLFLGSAFLDGGMAYATRRNSTPALLEADEREYYDLAGEIVEGHYEFHPRRVVGYVFTLAALRSAFGDRILTIQLAVSLAFSLTSPLTYLLARRELGSQQAGLTAGLGVMTWPLFVRYSATLYSETLALPVFAVFLLTVPGRGGSSTSRAWRWLGAGAMLGLCMHVRPMYLLYSPFGALVAYWRGPKGLRGLVPIASLAAGCLAVVLPWSAFLSSREGTFVLLSSNGGETLAGGFNPGLLRMGREKSKESVTPGGRVTWVGPGKWLQPADTGYLNAQEQSLPYTWQGNLLLKRASSWIFHHPGDASYLALRKLTYMWGIYPFWNGMSQTAMGNVPTLGLSLLGAAALIRFRRYLRELSIFWTLPVFVSLVALISWGSWRFREPGDVGLIVLAAALPWASEVTRSLAVGSAAEATGSE